MKRWLKGWDPGFLIVLLICLLAVWPLISRASLPEGTDAELHIFRLHELSTLIRSGEFYPRWAPNFYHGYGYPIFNYYAPLTYYLALPLELLPGVDAVGASKAVLVAGMLLGGLGLYGFTRDNWGRPAGYVAAALYVYSPYLHYIDPHIRGALPEAFSFGVFPLALWALDRLRRRPAVGPWLASICLVAAVILSHNLMGLFFYGLLWAWAVWLLVAGERGSGGAGERQSAPSVLSPAPLRPPLTPPAGRGTGRPRPSGEGWGEGLRPPRLTPIFAALLLALGLSAFFWLPVILERNAVTLHTLVGVGDNYDFRTHFLGLGELLAFSRRPDWGATQSPFLFNLGVAQWLGGLLGVAMLLLGRVRHRGQLLFFALALAVVLFLMMPISEPVWELIPFLPYFQFPWRLLGAAAALLAVLGAAGVEAVARSAGAKAPLPNPLPKGEGILSPSLWEGLGEGTLSPSLWEGLGEGAGENDAPAGNSSFPPAPLPPRPPALFPYLAAVALPMLLALPLSQPAPWQPFGEVSTARMSQIENSGRWLGTTSTADYVPATVITLPPRREQLVGPIAAGLPPDRVNREALPDGAVVTAEAVRPLLTRYHVSAPKQFRLRLYQFDFPGWQVRLDGEPATTEVAEPEGFIVVIVPEGEHVVEVEFGSTPARTAAWVVSLLSLLLAIAGGRWRVAWEQNPVAQDSFPVTRLRREDWAVAAVAGGITTGALLLQPLGLFHHQSSGQTLDVPAVATVANFGDQVALLGYNTSAERAAAGDTFDVLLYWQAQRPLEEDYQIFVHVLDAGGAVVAQSDKLHPGEFPTHRWPTDKYVPDAHQLALPPDLPPGDYRVTAGLWLRDEGRRLPVLDETGQVAGEWQELFTLQVR